MATPQRMVSPTPDPTSDSAPASEIPDAGHRGCTIRRSRPARGVGPGPPDDHDRTADPGPPADHRQPRPQPRPSPGQPAAAVAVRPPGGRPGACRSGQRRPGRAPRLPGDRRGAVGACTVRTGPRQVSRVRHRDHVGLQHAARQAARRRADQAGPRAVDPCAPHRRRWRAAGRHAAGRAFAQRGQPHHPTPRFGDRALHRRGDPRWSATAHGGPAGRRRRRRDRDPAGRVLVDQAGRAGSGHADAASTAR